MVMDPHWSTECTVTINVAAATDTGANNVPTHATPVAVTAQQRLESKRILQADGTERMASHHLRIPVSASLTSLADDAWVWLAADATANPSVSPPSDATVRPILEFSERWDPETRALSHWVLRV